jgi:glyoxylase-like metal-dependent hydrolase (beta-lactamase superfamily II)
VFFRQLLNDETACASYVFGCTTHPNFAVVEPHIDLVDEYIAQGATIVAVLDTHVQADHVSGMAELVARTGALTVEEMARTLYRSIAERLMRLPDHLVLYPSHYSGSVCGRGLSGNPTSTIGFERRHNRSVQFSSEEEFVQALLRDIPPAPEQQAAIVAANRFGRPLIQTSR